MRLGRRGKRIREREGMRGIGRFGGEMMVCSMGLRVYVAGVQVQLQ